MEYKDAQPCLSNQKLVFVHIDNPYSVSREQQHLVRSHATIASHRDGTRKKKSRATGQRRPRPPRQSTTKPRGSGAVELESSVTDSTDESTSDCRSERSIVNRVTTPSISRLGRGSFDPFDVLPIPPEPWHHWVLDYYVHVHLPPGIALVEQSPAEGRAFIDYHMRQSLEEPCLFYTQLLNACTPLVAEGRIALAVAASLRARLIATLNEAISDPKRALKTSTILTVASIALHERLYGDPKVAVEVHARACSRMLAMRGGVHALDLPRIGVEILKWTGSVLSADYAGRSMPDLLSAWTPLETRSRHPGYEAIASASSSE
ncbi:hypothetical protein B0A55_01495 [Friedmanniomyces simplex]|uniref:Transcription factor domain-containing protein n=1 Tax=Friedmanniomyces simplex TaxID=329884 RepID=A0A4U0Y3H6_9PEZI|nr:hypothetical protein B0A55_01495 [Friedmanniomyces simplex]